MQERYEAVYRHGCEYLNSFNGLHPFVIQAYWVRYFRAEGFNVQVRISDNDEAFIIYPEQNNLPIHIWRK